MSTPARSTYTVGLVGAGGIAAVHLPAWLVLGVDVLVYAPDDVAGFVARHGGGRVAGSLAELLAGCDAVDVCTPTPSHAAIAAAAAAAGRDVICEKPLARTSVEAEQLVADCDAAGVRLYPAHVVRWFSEYATLQAAVAAGAVGQVVVQRFSRIGSRPVMPWFADDTQSGGVLLDQSIHDLDFARWTAGEVARVFARESEVDGVRSAQCILQHAGGAVSQVSGTWARPGTRFRTTYEVAGTQGLLRHDSREHPELVLDGGADPPDGRGLLPDLGFAENPYLAELREIHTAFLGGPEPRVSADDAVAAIRIAEAAQRSLESGRAEAVTAGGGR